MRNLRQSVLHIGPALLVFAMAATAAAICCGLGAGLAYLAPFLASAALLANAGAAIRKAALATMVVYGICIATGGVGQFLPTDGAAALLLCCCFGFLLCLLAKQQHPPALALLALVFLRRPDVWQSLWLLGTASAVVLVAMAGRLCLISVWPACRVNP